MYGAFASSFVLCCTNESLDMLHFLASVRSSMLSNRRSQPVPQDFATALSQFGVTPHELLPHIQLPLAPQITQPPLAPSPPDEPLPPPTNSILGPDLTGIAIRRKFMPAHLPELPSRHTWDATPIYTKREGDARKIRELATEEGVLAERAMRKLMASAALAKPAKGGRHSEKDQEIWDQTLEAVLQMDENQRPTEDEIEWPGETQTAASFDSAISVNYDRRYWRKAARGS
jgi:transcription initiation factor TFIID subunit 8